MVRPEFDVFGLGRVAALDANGFALAVVIDALHRNAELDAYALGLARPDAVRARAPRNLAEGHSLDVVLRAEQVEELPHVLRGVGHDTHVAGPALRETLVQDFHRLARAGGGSALEPRARARRSKALGGTVPSIAA